MAVSGKGVRPNLFMLAWVTNVLTSPNLYIEFRFHLILNESKLFP